MRSAGRGDSVCCRGESFNPAIVEAGEGGRHEPKRGGGFDAHPTGTLDPNPVQPPGRTTGMSVPSRDMHPWPALALAHGLGAVEEGGEERRARMPITSTRPTCPWLRAGPTQTCRSTPNIHKLTTSSLLLLVDHV